MIKKIITPLLIIGLTIQCLNLHGQRKLNVILILSDDAGYADFGFHGSEDMKTPHLDRLAEEGMIFKQAYVTAAVCGPSRAGIMTGKYQQRFGYEENNVPGYMDNYCLMDDDMGLPIDEITIGEHLKFLGYKAGYFGKWHLGNADRFHPMNRGFDIFYGFRGGARSYFEFNNQNPNRRHEDWLERGFSNYGESSDYLTDVLANEANLFLESNSAGPFFMIVSFNAVHTPMEPKKEYLDHFLDLDDKRKQLAAMTLSMDEAVGSIIEKLKDLNLDENTLVIFTNDNGGPSDTNASINDPLSGTKANHLEGGIRVPFIMWCPTIIPGESEYKYPISSLDLLPTFYVAAGGKINDLDYIDGVDLWPYITRGKVGRPHETLFWKKENRGAIRENDWKLMRFPDRPAELYNLETDISENYNIASQYPEKVKDMFKKLFEWETTLSRPKWQLKREFEKKAMERMDNYRKKSAK